jgi:aryl-alcohol dehydrogenase-like predicted oxidoreductase
MNMELRPLGNCGIRVSALSLGAMTFGESQGFMKGVTSTDEEARRVFDTSVDAGMNLVDTANVYGDGASETLTGQWIKGKRSRVLLATKCRFAMGVAPGGSPSPWGQGLSRRHILEACDASLARLGTDFIDLYQVHMQDALAPIDETLRALGDLVQSGKVRYVGCSNYTGYRLAESVARAAALGTPRYESVQLQWSLAERGAERETIPACRAFHLGVLVWSPLASGLLSGKYSRGKEPPPGSRLDKWRDQLGRRATERVWNVVDQLVKLADERGATPAQVALAWLLAKPETSSIIVGARTVAQLDDNLKALEVKLSPDDVKALDKTSEPEWGYPYDMIGRSQRW